MNSGEPATDPEALKYIQKVPSSAYWTAEDDTGRAHDICHPRECLQVLDDALAAWMKENVEQK